MKLIRFLLIAALLALPAIAQKSITSTQCATIGVSQADAVVGIQVVGTWTGTLQPQGTIQGQTPFNVQVTPSTSTTAQSTITASGGYFALVAGYSTFQICGSTVATGTAVVYLNVSQAPAGSGAGGAPASSAFSALTPGTNTNGAMHVGTGSSLDATGAGTITATAVPWSGVTAASSTVANTEGTGGSLSQANLVGQVAGSQLWMMKGLTAPTYTSANSGGNIGSAQNVQWQYTFNTAAGETLASVKVSGNPGAPCVSGNCTVTMTAPTLPTGVTGYTAYFCDTSAGLCTAPVKVLACVNITTGCTVTDQSLNSGVAVPTTNTAWIQPPTVQPSTFCPSGMIPSMFFAKSNNQNFVWGGVDVKTDALADGILGTPLICHRTYFSDAGDQFANQAGKNAFISINHQSGAGVQAGNQDRALWITHATPAGDTATRWGIEGIQVEVDVNGAPVFNGSPDGEVTAFSGQISDVRTSNTSSGTYGSNVARLQYFKSGAGTTTSDGGKMDVIDGIYTHNNAAAVPGGTQAIIYDAQCTNGIGGVLNNLSCTGLYFRSVGGSANRFGNGQIAVFIPSGMTPSGSGVSADYGVRNDIPGLPFYLNGPTTLSRLTSNNVQNFPMDASLNVTGSVTGVQAAIAQPSSVNCTGGASTYGYKFIGIDGNGGTIASTTQNSGATCTNPLTVGNPATVGVTFTFSQVAAFKQIDVYRVSGPMTTGKIGSLTCAAAATAIGCTAFSDTGLAGDGATAPTVNTTGSLGGPLYRTTTNCAASGTAANPSVVSCVAAPAGAVFCDVASSAGTCTVNTTAVTATSRILITPSAADGTELSKTCNTALTFGTAPLLAAKVAGTSFTINMPTVVTNGACFEYFIVN